jgi:hypothetical protein
MVIKIEYGIENNTTLRTYIQRDVIPPQLAKMSESFFAQQQYRWGKMYSLKGKESKLIRQFGVA